MKIQVAATGKLVKGSVFDTNKRELEIALRNYDPQLYVQWNPTKNRGQGCWEVRRRPNQKERVYKGSHNGVAYYSLEYKEFDLVHHVVDLPYLTFRVMDWLYAHDTFRMVDRKSGEADQEFMDRFENTADYNARAFNAEQRRKMHEETKYQVREDRKYIREFQEMIQSGFNPARIAQYWGKH